MDSKDTQTGTGNGPAPEEPNGRSLSEWVALATATSGGAGLLPVAPGTFGSLVALPIFVLLSPLWVGLWWLTWLALLVLGIWAADLCEPIFGRKDDGRIVVDEVVGQLLALMPLLALEIPVSWLPLVTGFVLFRVFDVWKPGPVRWAERRYPGGLGVMMDDVVAGALAAAVLALLLWAGERAQAFASLGLWPGGSVPG